MDWTKTTERWDEKHVGFVAFYTRGFTVVSFCSFQESGYCSRWRWLHRLSKLLLHGSQSHGDHQGTGHHYGQWKTQGVPGTSTSLRFTLSMLKYYEGNLCHCLLYQHIEAETKWPPFCWRHFQVHFFEWKCLFEFWLKFHRSLFLRDWLTIFQHWFR